MTSWMPGLRCRSSRAAARPMMPPPMIATSNTEECCQRAPAFVLLETDHVCDRRWAHEPLELQLAQRLQLRQVLNRRRHLLVQQDLSVGGLVAEAGGAVGDGADSAVVHALLEA